MDKAEVKRDLENMVRVLKPVTQDTSTQHEMLEAVSEAHILVKKIIEKLESNSD